MSSISLIKSGGLPATMTTNLSTPPSASPFPPPPPPPGFDPESDDEGDISDDESLAGDSDDDEPNDGPPPPRPTLPSPPNSASISSLNPSSLTSKTSAAASTALAISTSNSKSYSSNIGTTIQSTLSTSTISRPSRSSETSLSSSDVATPTSFDQANTTALPIGEPDSALETKAGSSPLGTAGIVLAAVFGFVALITTFYLLYRLRKRRRSYNSPNPSTFSDPEKSDFNSSAQETGIIFGRGSTHGRRKSSPRTFLNPFAQQDDQPARGAQENRPGRSRFSFLNRRWYSTGTEFSNTDDQQRQQQQQASTFLSEASPSSVRRGSFSFFNFNIGLGSRSQTRANSQYYPSQQVPEPTTPSTITRLTRDITRNISTRTTASDHGSGHARAYAHHGVAPVVTVATPRSARFRMSSLSTRWLRRRSNNDASNPASPRTPRLATTSTSHPNTNRNQRFTTHSEAISETSDMYGSSQQIPYPDPHSDTDPVSPLSPQNPALQSRWSDSSAPFSPLTTITNRDTRMTSTTNDFGDPYPFISMAPAAHSHSHIDLNFNAHPRDVETGTANEIGGRRNSRRTSMPRIPLPVALR